jgi:hypothetical protein
MKKLQKGSLEIGYMLVNIKKVSKMGYMLVNGMEYMLVNLKPSQWDAR